MLKLIGLISIIAAVRSANIIERLSVQDGAICDDRIPAYLVSDGHKLHNAENKVVIADLDEQECKNMCTDNKDEKGEQVMCSSFTYDTKEKTCAIHRGKAMPAGKFELKAASSHRYYEKFCLPEGTPADCGESPFFRADQAVLIGFAKNVSHTKNFAMCIQACIEMSAECRSAMFFGAAGECILNVASAQDAPDVFAEEEDEEKVVYFENGCVLDNQIRSQKKHNAAKSKKPTIKLATNATKINASEGSKKEAQAISAERKEEAMKKKSSEEKEKSEEMSEKESSDDSETVTLKTPIGRKSKSKNNLLKNAALSNGDKIEDAWGPWSEECRSFDERRPCQNGNRVGFQSRQCLRTPFECQGPFFRYCIAAC